ncbi:MAG: DUF7305 domain-containing protein [Limisphaerales bacterium]
MKLKPQTPKKKQQGGALTVALLYTMVIGVSIGSYLSLIGTQNMSTMRSLSWNSALPAAEAGVEEALTHLRYNGTSNLDNDGWTLKSDGWYQKCASLGGASAYVVRIQPSEPPIILATGIARAPYGPSNIEPTDAGILGAAIDNKNFVQRTVRIETVPDITPFKQAVVAQQALDIQGNRMATDSFDSASSSSSSNGCYDRTKNRDCGDVVAHDGVRDSRNCGDAEIMGRVSTGHCAEVKVGDRGSVGDKDWVENDRRGIQDGKRCSDLNVAFPKIEKPFEYGKLPRRKTDTEGREWECFEDGDYRVAKLCGKVKIEGKCRIYCEGDVDLDERRGDCLEISENAEVELYVNGEKADFGKKCVKNKTEKASKFKYYGTESNKCVKLSGDGRLAAAVYAPKADIELGCSSSRYDDDDDNDDRQKRKEEFVGSCVGKNVKLNSDCEVHYDEALSREKDNNKSCTGYTPTKYKQLSKETELPKNCYEGVDVKKYGRKS